MRKGSVLLLFMLFPFVVLGRVRGPNKKPHNIVLILTDDQDILLGGMKPMVQTRKLLVQQGTSFTNAYVTTPICCPSRASILTGRYLHNHNTVNNSLEGGCNSISWQANSEQETFATYLKKAGYRTMYAGKYLNQYGHTDAKGVHHIPPGWDWWIGLVGNSKYYNYVLSVNGTAVSHGDDYRKDYLTDVIKRYAVEFLKQKQSEIEPFLMVLSTPAPHAPFIPAPHYKGFYKNLSAPRQPNFNVRSQGKHWLTRMPPTPLSQKTLNLIDNIYRSRLETLLSVDDLVAEVIGRLQSLKILDNTYVIFTSDHGYHVGQFGLPWDKRQPYEFDLKVPLILRGPELPRKSVVETPVLSIDLAPTILTLANVQIPINMDGKSFVSKGRRMRKSWRIINKGSRSQARSFLIEYHGEGNMHTNSPNCVSSSDNTLSECSLEAECKCQDAVNNTYNCVRHISRKCNVQYCEFLDAEAFIEFYDLKHDPYQLHNLGSSMQSDLRQNYSTVLKDLIQCRGISCTDRTLKYHSNFCSFIR